MFTPNDLDILTNLQANKLYKKEDLAKITNFTLRHLYLKAVPKCINRLSNLTKLDLALNKFTKIPDFIFDLVNLEYLDFTNNNIDYIPDSINKLVNLTYLSFDSNDISDISFSLPKLKCLCVCHNKLKKINLNFDMMTDLEELHCMGNKISNFPEKLCSMPKLKTIIIGSNNIRSLPRNIMDLKNLGYLDIFNNPFSEFPNVQNLHNLEFLDVNCDKLLTLPHNITELKNLKLLKMSGNNYFSGIDVTIDDIVLEHFSKLPSFNITFGNPISDDLKLKLEKYNISVGTPACRVVEGFDNAKYLICYKMLQNRVN